ncbi:uncharacterized protein LOC135936517 isoform X2 [Cloeon dipterum]|uniref:uncharacterized protein LOC135936517 isoform X2 n=1 Tax=Cloeon dipterum TaxID=197152 RepID=UPI00322025DA
MTVEAPLEEAPQEVPPPQAVPSCKPSQRLLTPSAPPVTATSVANGGQLEPNSDFISDAHVDFDLDYVEQMSPVLDGSQCESHLPYTEGSASDQLGKIVHPVAGPSGLKTKGDRKKPRELEGPDIPIPRNGVPFPSVRAGFDDSSTDSAESDECSSQETAGEVAASKVSNPREKQAAKPTRRDIARTDQRTPEKKGIADQIPGTPGKDLPHNKVHLIKVTYYSMSRKENLPDFFLIPDSQSPRLQTLAELKQLTLDKSGDCKVLLKAEIVYSQLYITTETLYTLMNQLVAAEQLLSQSVPTGARFLHSVFTTLNIDPEEKEVYIIGVHERTEWRAFNIFSNLLKKHTRKVYENFWKPAGSRKFHAMGGSCLQLSPYKKMKSTPIKLLALASGVKKKQYCYFCGKNYGGNIWRHLREFHRNEPLIKDKFAENPNKEQLKVFFKELVLLGNGQHNAAVMQYKQGTLVPARRTQSGTVHKTNLCPYCSTLHTSRNFRRHLQACRVRREEEEKVPEPAVDIHNINRIEKLRANLDPSYTSAVDKILMNMRDKRIASFIVTDDALVIRVVKNFGLQQETGNNGVQISRRNIRLLHALYTGFKEHPEIPGLVNSLRDICKRSVWQGLPSNRPASKTDRILEVIHMICGGGENKTDFHRPNDVMTLSSLVRQVASELQQERFEEDKDRTVWVEECRLLIEYLGTKRFRMYTTTRAAKQKKSNEKLHKTHVSPDDLMLYNNHLEGMCDFHHIKLLAAKDPSEIELHYRTLASHLNLAFCSFNARRATEGSFITLEDYAQRNNYSGQNSEALSKAQQELAERYDVITSTGKGSSKVLSLIKPEWRDYFCTLADKAVRAAAGIPENCAYLFGTCNGRPMDTRRVQEKAAKLCLAAKPTSLRARAIRTSFATTVGHMQLSGPAKKLLCLLMGHSQKVHDNYYDLPTGLGFNLMVGRALEIFQTGDIKKHKGTTLEEAAQIRTTDANAPNAVQEDDFTIEDLQDAILLEDADEEEVEAELSAQAKPKKRGRPPGSKNRVKGATQTPSRKLKKKTAQSDSAETDSEHSDYRPSAVANELGTGKDAAVAEVCADKNPVKRGRGRPPGKATKAKEPKQKDQRAPNDKTAQSDSAETNSQDGDERPITESNAVDASQLKEIASPAAAPIQNKVATKKRGRPKMESEEHLQPKVTRGRTKKTID